MGESQPQTRIAIVGRAGRFPDAPDIAAFWKLLADGRSAMRRLSDTELLNAGVGRAALADPNYVKAASVLPDMECFDAGFFGFSPHEASILDPQHRHFLECGWEALEDAGHLPEDFDGRIGVYAGSGMQAYLPYNLLSNPELVRDVGLFLLRHTGNDKDFLTTRLSYLLNLTGPSVAIQTACSTSLVAVHQAMNALLNMECDMALAGGVTIELPHRVGYHYAEGEILSPDGTCRAFDDQSQGTVFGSGVGLVVLRRFEDAVADGDDIKAVLLASAVNNDGAVKASYLAPSVEGQAEAAAEALALSGLGPEAISYIEAHGTGTPIGDPIELAALNQVYGDAAHGSIGIGSVKTNIGHLDTAAGIASLIKVTEAMRRDWLPESLNFHKPNSRFDFAASPFRVETEGRSWARIEGRPRRAAINSLGVGGTNAHVIVEEAPAPAASPEDGAWQVCLFSGRDEAARDRVKPKWQAFLGDAPPAMADIARTLRIARRAFPARMAVAARTPDELSRALGERSSSYLTVGAAQPDPPSVVFLFPGGGAQYPGAGAELLRQSPVFAEAVALCFSALPDTAPPDLREMMFDRDMSDEAARQALSRSRYAIPALFILEYAYAKLWESWGIRPDAILAHSVGEYAGAVVSGALHLKDALKVVTLRGQVMDAAPAGAMTTVPLGEDETRAVLGEALDVAAVNSADTTVVSGRTDAIEAFERSLAEQGLDPQRIHIDVAAHSRQLQNQLDSFRWGFNGVAFGRAGIPMVSSLRGDWAAGGDLVSADYWVRHLRETVRFRDAVCAVLDRPDRVVIEVGPGQTLGPLVWTAGAPNPPRSVLASAPRPKDSADELGVALTALGGLWASGAEIDWSRTGAPEGRRVSVPTYAFAKDRHWIEPGRGHLTERDDDDMTVPLQRREHLGDWFETPFWHKSPLRYSTPSRAGTWLVFGREGDPLTEALIAAINGRAAEALLVVPGSSYCAPEDGRASIRPERTEDYEALLAHPGVDAARIISLWPSHDPDQAFDSAFLLVRSLQRGGLPAGRIAFITSGAADAGDVPVVAATAAAVLGVVRVSVRELQGLEAQAIDIAPEAETKVAAEQILEEFDASATEDRVALRGKIRWTEARQRAEVPDPKSIPHRLRKGGVYVITGGTGGIGRSLAHWLGTEFRARVALLSRSATELPRLARDIGASGGALRVVAADVTERDALASALAEIKGSWGQIDGVIHAAGSIDDAPMAMKSLENARAVMSAKVTGALHLSELLPPGEVDLFAVFSSSSVIIGPAGQSDYVAANAVLEAIASSRPDGLAVAWGIWRDIGMAARTYGQCEDAIEGRHPLLGPAVVEQDRGASFTRMLDPESHWIIGDHRVGGVAVLPGMGTLEIARAAYAETTGQRTCEVRELSFLAPLAFPEALPRQVRVRLAPLGDGYAFTLESATAPGLEPTLHAEAILAPAATDGLPDLLATPGTTYPTGRVGHPAAADQIQFGPHWGSVGEIQTGEGLAEARVSLHGTDAKVALSECPAHPGLSDMATTVGLNLLSETGSSAGLFAPATLSRVRIIAPLVTEVVGRTVLRQHVPEREALFDAAILDIKGNPLMVFEGLNMRYVPVSALASLEREEGTLTDQMLARGIASREAPTVFARAFSASGKVIVSSVSLDDVRARIAIDMAAEVPFRETGTELDSGDFANPIEARLAELFGDVLRVNNVGGEDDFFSLGGHSLLTVRLMSRVRREFDVNLPISALVSHATPRSLAQLIQNDQPNRAENAAPEIDLKNSNNRICARAAEPDSCDTTSGQQEIFAAILMDPEASRAYNLSFSLITERRLDVDALTVAVGDLIRRHPSLRSRFDASGLSISFSQPKQVSLPVADYTAMEPDQAIVAATRLRAEFADAPFDLANGPVMRAQLILHPAEKTEIVFCVHHIVCDGWSIGLITRDFAALYTAHVMGEVPAFGPAEGIVEFVEAEKACAATAEAARHRDYWVSKYADGGPTMEVPTDHPRPAIKTSNGARYDTVLSSDLEGRLRDMARRQGASLENVIFAAFNLYLSRLARTDEVVVGLPTSGQASLGLEHAVGHCVNFLPIRTAVEPDAAFSDFLANARRTLFEALDHQNYTYGDLMRVLRLRRDPSRIQLVPVIFNIDNVFELDGPTLGDNPAEFRMNPRGYEHFEVVFNLTPVPGQVRMDWSYNTDLFERSSIERHAARFFAVLEDIARDPETPVSRIGRGGADELRPASGSHIDPGAAGPQTLTEIFSRVVEDHADSAAVRFGSEEMTYRELDARSDALAALLAEKGAGPGKLVGISSQRCLNLIVAVIGVLKSGSGWVPFDESLPAERLEFMAQDTGVPILLGECQPVTDTGVVTIPFAEFPGPGALPGTCAIDGESICYVMYTSGTTGRPKGVVLPHRSIVRLFGASDWIGMTHETVTLMSSPFGFDASAFDIFAPLLRGGCVAVPPKGTLSIQDLADAIASQGVNTLWLTSGLFHAVVDMQPTAFAQIDQLVVGGDIVSPVQTAIVMKACPELTVINGYGPTETHISNTHRVTEEDLASGLPIPIGQAVAGTQNYIVDQNLNPVEPGMQGELCISGRALGLGYWNRPELTAEKFVPAPWDRELLLYRTGDLALDPGNGEIRFFGRIDTQVKIRGFRVELGEVEVALESHPLIRQATVAAVVPEGQSDKLLAAYYVAEGTPPTRRALQEHVKTRLPEFSRPTFYTQLETIPLNANGKVDRLALPVVRPTLDQPAACPNTKTETFLDEIWEGILGHSVPGVEADFFEHGGHSLLAVRLFEQIRCQFGVELPISALFANPTIRDLAQVIDGKRAEKGVASEIEDDWDTSIVMHKGQGNAARPLFIVGGVGGNLNNLWELSQLVGETRPMIGFQTRGILGHEPRHSIEEMASEHIRYMRQYQATGPYLIAGYSGGAITAFEMARQLLAQREEVAQLVILDTYAPGFAVDFVPSIRLSLAQRLVNEWQHIRTDGFGSTASRLSYKLRSKFRLGRFNGIFRLTNPAIYRLWQVEIAWRAAAAHYQTERIDAPTTLVLTRPNGVMVKLAHGMDASLGWDSVLESGLAHKVFVPGNHVNMGSGEGAKAIAAVLRERLAVT